MLSLYLLCLVIGLGWSVASFALGKVFGDAGGPHGEVHVGGAFGEGGHGHASGESGGGALDLPLFSPTAIAGYLTGFGATGLGLAGGLGIESPWIHVPVAFVGAAVLGVGVAWATVKLLQVGETSSEARVVALQGRSGELSVSIPENGMGALTYQSGGSLSTAPARSASGGPIAQGTRVRIVRIDGPVFVVEPEGISSVYDLPRGRVN